MIKGRGVQLGVSLALSSLFLWIAFKDVKFSAAMERLQTVELSAVVAFLLLMVVAHISRVFRWGLLLEPFVDVPRATLFRIALLGFMLIVLLPLRLGEFARPYLLKRDCGTTFGAGMASVAVERSIDGLLVTLLFFLSVNFLPAQYAVPDALKVAGWASFAVFGGAIFASIALLLGSTWVDKLVRLVGEPISRGLTDKALGLLHAFVDGLRSLPSARAIVGFAGWTVIYWVATGVGYTLLLEGFGWDVPAMAGFTVMAVLVIGIMIPAGPGFVGTFQGAILAGLAIFGINADDAAAFGLVAYPIAIGVGVLSGIPYLFGGRGLVAEVVQAAGSGEAAANP